MTKQHKQVLLPTEEHSNIYKADKLYYDNHQGYIARTTGKIEILMLGKGKEILVQYQHLYILSTEEIKEGDWVYCTWSLPERNIYIK